MTRITNWKRTRRWLAPLTVALSAGCGGPQPPPFKPVADVKQLMEAVVDPSADVVWDSVATTFTKDGMEERRPTTDADWPTSAATP